jgi:hypothetical protein
MTVLWRDPWLKPLSDGDIGSDSCALCKKEFKDGAAEFVTACEFCDIGVMHDLCADKHVMQKHRKQVEAKINDHRDRRLHGYQ